MLKRLILLAVAAFAGWAVLGLVQRRTAPEEPFAQFDFNSAHADADDAADANIADEIAAELETPHTAEADLAERAFVAAALDSVAHHHGHATYPAHATDDAAVPLRNDDPPA